MTLSNSIFAVSGAATFLDARKDMSNLFACDTSLEPHPGLLTVGGSSAANGNVVVGMSNRMAVTVRPFQAVLNRLGALLIMNDGDVVVSLQAAPSANSRIDVVYVKQRETRAPISDSEDGPIIGVVTGTANLTPVAPQVPDGAVALAQVKVPSGVTNTTASGVVITQVYPFAATRGEELRFRTKGDMDAFAALDGTKAVTLSDNAHYVRNGNAWVGEGVVSHPYALAKFRRSDGQLQVNSGMTLMQMTLSHNDFNGVTIVNDGNGGNVSNLPVGDYSVYASLPLSTNAGWLNLNVGLSSGVTNLGPLVSEQLTGGNGYTRLNLNTMLRVTQSNTKIHVFTNNNVAGTMREEGFMFVDKLG